MLTKNELRIDLIIVLGIILAAIPISIFFQVRFLTSTIFFFAIPSLFLFFRKPKNVTRIFAGTFTGTIVAFTIDFLAEINNAWSWAPEGQLVFANKLFGLVPIDVIVWYAFWLFFTVVFYEHFFEHERSNLLSPRFKRAMAVFVGVMVLVILLFYISPNVLQFRYAYFVIAVIGALPLTYIISKKPSLVIKFLKASLLPIFLFLSFELTALKLDQWRFPGEYIGVVQLFGLAFPFEEFLFWILLGTAITLSYYELFVDDEK